MISKHDQPQRGGRATLFRPAGARVSSCWQPRSYSRGYCLSRLRRWALATLLCLFNPVSFAAPPVLEQLFPVALQVGTTNVLSVFGKFEPWPVQLRSAQPGIVFTPETNKAKFSVIVPADAPPEPRLVWASNDEGVSEPRFLIVTRDAPATEIEPNDDFRKPQIVTNLPVHLNGRLAKNGDVDSFAVTLSEGQTLVASLQAYTLMSGVDALLRLTDSRGVQVAWNHDDGRSFDPFLAWTAPRADTYVVQVMGFVYPAGSEIRLHGSEKTVYRLHLRTGTYLGHTLPLGAQRGVRTQLQLVGWNLGALADRPHEFDGTGLATNGTTAEITVPGVENVVTMPVGDGPELIEAEPNDAVTNAPLVAVPSAITGAIATAGDRDRFAFDAKKDERLVFTVQAASLGFPLDAWLEIQDATGKTLVTVDDSGGADPEIAWTAPAEGRFQVVVGSRVQRGDPNFRYRLNLQRAQPDFRATVAAGAFTLKPGATNDVKLTVTRSHGHAAKLTAAFGDLPTGVSAAPVEVPEKGGDVTLQLIATTNAPAVTSPLRVVVRGEAGERAATYELVTAGENNGVPQGFRELVIPRTEQLWLTVTKPETPAEKPKAAE